MRRSALPGRVCLALALEPLSGDCSLQTHLAPCLGAQTAMTQGGVKLHIASQTISDERLTSDVVELGHDVGMVAHHMPCAALSDGGLSGHPLGGKTRFL